MDHLGNMRAFVLVIECGSITGAANRLAVSKSIISRQLSTLENHLGARLLQRTTRKLSPTETGRAYYERAVRILADLDEADGMVGTMQSIPQGRLRVTAPISFGINHISPILAGFLTDYPQVDLDLSLTDRFVDLIEDGYDAAIRIGRLADSSLVAKRLTAIRTVLCASPDYLARHGVPTHPDDLVRHHCISHLDYRGNEWNFVLPGGISCTPNISSRIRVGNGDGLRTFALAGLGLVKLPSFFIESDLRQGLLQPVLDEFIPQEGAVYIVYPHNRHLSSKVRAFVNYLVKKFASNR